MNCKEAHLAIGAEPEAMTPALEQHLHACAACADYRKEMLELNGEIRRALAMELPAPKSDAATDAALARATVQPSASTPRPAMDGDRRRTLAAANESWLAALGRQWALAASVLFAVGVGLVLWGALPRHSLAADVVAHVISEPLPPIERPIPQSALDAVLSGARLRLDPEPGKILFAQTCFFRGRLVPHFVVRSGNAAVTVMVLQHESLARPEHFSESGYSGILLPNGRHGSIAVLSRADVDTEKQAREILSALHSQPAA